MAINFQQLEAQRRGADSSSQPVPCPIGGWNTRDARSIMPLQDAITLDNLIPAPGKVKIRGGYSEYATGLSTDVETLAEYHVTSTRKFLAAAGSKIYDISSAGAAVELATGYSNARWETVQFNAQLHFFNGADTPQVYNGTTISSSTFTGSGLAPATLNGVTVFKNRMFLWDDRTQDYWYGAVNASAGALTKFPLSLVSRRGGNLVSINTLSRDSGSGPDDYIAFIMTTEVLVYQGSDPGDASDWAIVGRYPFGEPVSKRAINEDGSDIKIVTNADIVSLLDVITKKPEDIEPSKLCGAFADAARSYGSNFGWEAITYPRSNLVLYNIPIATGTTYHQYGINTLTGGAFRFTGWNARTFGIYNKRLYFGGGGVVYKADDGLDDNGANIAIAAQDSYKILGTVNKKHFTQLRLYTKIDGNVTLNLGLAFDYGDVFISQTVSSDSVGTPWDTSDWDTSDWSPEGAVRTAAYGASGVGQTVSLKLAASLNGQDFEWYQTDFGFEVLDDF